MWTEERVTYEINRSFHGPAPSWSWRGGAMTFSCCSNWLMFTQRESCRYPWLSHQVSYRQAYFGLLKLMLHEESILLVSNAPRQSTVGGVCSKWWTPSPLWTGAVANLNFTPVVTMFTWLNGNDQNTSTLSTSSRFICLLVLHPFWSKYGKI